jgi:hypothetical protein
MTNPNVLAACPPFALPTLHKVLGAYVRFVPVASLEAAKTALASNPRIALVLCGVHFDESRMYELLQHARRLFAHIPFVCVRVLDAEIPRVSREALRIAAESLGATAFIDLPTLVSQIGNEAAERELRNVVLGHLPLRKSGNGPER